jgi:hypothetical protein
VQAVEAAGRPYFTSSEEDQLRIKSHLLRNFIKVEISCKIYQVEVQEYFLYIVTLIKGMTVPYIHGMDLLFLLFLLTERNRNYLKMRS